MQSWGGMSRLQTKGYDKGGSFTGSVWQDPTWDTPSSHSPPSEGPHQSTVAAVNFAHPNSFAVLQDREAAFDEDKSFDVSLQPPPKPTLFDFTSPARTKQRKRRVKMTNRSCSSNCLCNETAKVASDIDQVSIPVLVDSDDEDGSEKN